MRLKKIIHLGQNINDSLYELKMKVDKRINLIFPFFRKVILQKAASNDLRAAFFQCIS